MTLREVAERHIFSHKWFLPVLLGSCFSAAISIAMPFVTARYIDTVLLSRNVNLLYTFLGLFVALFLGEIASAYLTSVFAVKLAAQSTFNLNLAVVEHIQNLPLRFFDKTNSVYLNQRVNDDAYAVVSFVLSKSVSLLVQSASIIAVACIIVRTSLPLAALLCSVSLLYFALYYGFKGRLYAWAYRVKEGQNGFFAKLNEQFRKIRFIQINVLAPELRSSLVEKFEALFDAVEGHARVNYWFSTSGGLVRQASTAALFIFGGLKVMRGELSVGQFIVLNSYFGIAIGGIAFFLNLGSDWQTARASLDRLSALLSEAPEPTGSIRLGGIDRIEFRDVDFAYGDGRPILANFSRVFEKGKIYCLVGENGSGKSTFLNLLLGLHRPQRGSVLFDETDLSGLDIRHLRRRIVAISEQEPTLFQDTLRNNLLLGVPEHRRRNLAYWQSRTGADALAARLPGGLDYVVDEGSGNVSGGEKQKVSQARAFLKDAQVLILDEPTSALDMESIGNLKRILLDLRRDKIIIAISHHSGFCEVADEVVRLRPSALPERVHLCGAYEK